MKKGLCWLLCLSGLWPLSVMANTTLQELQHMEARKGIVSSGDHSHVIDHKTTPQFELVLFMQGHCIHCRRFDPVLNKFSHDSGLKVFAYTLDGRGAIPYPNAIPAPQPVIHTFFGQRYPVATPTLFLVKMKSPDDLQAYPVMQGEAMYSQLAQRVEQLMSLALEGGQ